MSKSPITETLLREALDLFWGRITLAFPEATSGDLSPDAEVHLERAARAATEEWVSANVPPVMPLHNIDGFVCRGSVMPGYVLVLDNGQWYCNRCGFTCIVEDST